MTCFRYCIYGFNIASDLELPGFPEFNGIADVCISLVVPTRKEIISNHIVVDSNEATLEILGIGIFTVRQGREVIVEPLDDTDLDIIRYYLSGTVLGIVLYQRGFLTFHASCLSIQGHACLFAGDVGAGKSTLACHLLKDGGRLLADDITAIKMNDGIPMVYPGFPMMRLNPDITKETIGNYPHWVIDLVAKLGKKCYRIDTLFETQCRPLDYIFLLRYGDVRKIEKIPRHQSLFHCLPQTFVNFQSPLKQAPLFLELSSILKYTNVYNFIRVRDLNNISSDCDCIIRQVIGR